MSHEAEHASRANWGEILLNDVSYPVVGQGRYNNLGMFERKITFGDYTKDSDDVISAVIYSDLSGGGQIDELTMATVQRYWHGVIEARYPNQILLPPKVDTFTGPAQAWPLGDSPHSPSGLRYISYGTSLRRWDGTDYDLEVGTLGGVPVNKGVAFSSKLYIPLGANGYQTYNGAAVAAGTAGITAIDFAMFGPDNALYALEHDGQLSWTYDGSTWISPPNVKVDPAYTPKRLAVFRNAEGDPAIAIVTNRALFFFDPISVKLWLTFVKFPPHPDYGNGAIVWRTGEDLYIALGMDTIRFNGSTAMPGTGPARDEGTPAALRGKIVDLADEWSSLFALVAGEQVPVGPTVAYAERGSYQAQEPSPPSQSAYSSLFLNSGRGWHCHWESDVPGTPTRAYLSIASSEYRLVWGFNNTIHHLDQRRTAHSPAQGQRAGLDRYAPQGYVEWGNFTAAMEGFDKIASHNMMRADHATATELIRLQYRTDITDYWQTIGEVTAKGRKSLRFGVDDHGFSRGAVNEWIRFRLELERADATADDVYKSPVLRSMVHKFVKVPDSSGAFTVTIPLPKRRWKGRGGSDLRRELDALNGAIEFIRLVHNRDTYRVKISGVTGTDETGPDYSGQRQVSFVVIPDGLTDER